MASARPTIRDRRRHCRAPGCVNPKWPQGDIFVGPTAAAFLAEGVPDRIALLVACFRAYAQAAATDDEPHLQDLDWELLRSPDPMDVLDAGPFVGWGLRHNAGFLEAYRTCSQTLASQGPRPAVRQALG